MPYPHLSCGQSLSGIYARVKVPADTGEGMGVGGGAVLGTISWGLGFKLGFRCASTSVCMCMMM